MACGGLPPTPGGQHMLSVKESATRPGIARSHFGLGCLTRTKAFIMLALLSVGVQALCMRGKAVEIPARKRGHRAGTDAVCHRASAAKPVDTARSPLYNRTAALEVRCVFLGIRHIDQIEENVDD